MQFFVSTQPPTEAQAAQLAAVMPPLAGQGLEPPHFHKTSWSAGHKLLASEDPDRTRHGWVPPEFVFTEDPAKQRNQAILQEMTPPWVRSDQRFVRVVRQVLTEEQCAALLQHANGKGFTPALINIGSELQQLEPTVRNCHSVVVDSPALAAWLFGVLQPYLPERLSDGSCLVELNERLHFLCYTPGQHLQKHQDGHHQRCVGHPKAGNTSRIAVQIHLHDVPKPCGGATTFFPGRPYSVKHQPEVGSALVFTQDLDYEGSFVREGIAYTLQVEVMYSQPVSVPVRTSSAIRQRIVPVARHRVTRSISCMTSPMGDYPSSPPVQIRVLA